jgi:hypothetical protein
LGQPQKDQNQQGSYWIDFISAIDQLISGELMMVLQTFKNPRNFMVNMGEFDAYNNDQTLTP